MSVLCCHSPLRRGVQPSSLYGAAVIPCTVEEYCGFSLPCDLFTEAVDVKEKWQLDPFVYFVHIVSVCKEEVTCVVTSQHLEVDQGEWLMLSYVFCTCYVKLIHFRLQLLLPKPLFSARCRELFAKLIQQNAEQNGSDLWHCLVCGNREKGKDEKWEVIWYSLANM